MKIDKKAIRDLAEILNDTNLTEIEVEEKDMKIRVARGGSAQVNYVPQTQMVAPQAPAAVAPVVAAPVVADANHPGALKSPMVGTVYLSPEPGASNFVSVGKSVAVGDTIMIVEAMKVMNPIKAEKAGVVTQIMVKDAQPVEFGEVLAIIE